MARNFIKVKGKTPKMAKVGWWSLGKKKRKSEQQLQKKHRARVKKADLERRDASAKYKLALKRRAELEAKKGESNE